MLVKSSLLCDMWLDTPESKIQWISRGLTTLKWKIIHNFLWVEQAIKCSRSCKRELSRELPNQGIPAKFAAPLVILSKFSQVCPLWKLLSRCISWYCCSLVRVRLLVSPTCNWLVEPSRWLSIMSPDSPCTAAAEAVFLLFVNLKFRGNPWSL